MTFLDTGYLIALARKEDALHARAAAWSSALTGRFLTTEYVLCEFLNAMSSQEDRPAAHLLFEQLRSHPLIEIAWVDRGLFDSGVALHQSRLDKRWSLTDCISFQVMQEHSIRDALTHDHHFEQAGFRSLLRQEPP